MLQSAVLTLRLVKPRKCPKNSRHIIAPADASKPTEDTKGY